MAAGSTYEPIATNTLATNQTTVTFSSIPSTYTDLIIVFNGGIVASGPTGRITYNGDTSANYSQTDLWSTTAQTSARLTGQTYITAIGRNSSSSLALNDNSIIHIMNYSNSTTYKSLLMRQNQAASFVYLGCGVWRSTAVINQISFAQGGGGFLAGSTFTLYGITAA
jgi:hypothetical protein